MPAEISTGKCLLCGTTSKRASMTRHLQSCLLSHASLPEKGPGGEAFHVFVEGEWRAYWMHLLVPAKALLATLDGFLRRTWLECCGHLSAFTIGGVRYSSSPMREYGEEGMAAPVSRIFQGGLKLLYEYDFGSTTNLGLTVIGMRAAAVRGGRIRLLARNDPPRILCGGCGQEKLATHVCTECVWSDGGWLCDTCAAGHECGSEVLLPVVNSPRVGVCSYSG